MGFAYFEYLCKSFCHYNPSCMAKILGAFKIKMKFINSSKSQSYCFFMMENILLNINEKVCIKYDLKGASKKRFIAHKMKG